ncbi:MAG: hypothetical protein EP329_12560 [Deltaproteobacteria bacterium]|nr:MAG: hypothetical protein EP329_12560 [Deltaproteobacteria bacterium]
MSAPEPAVARGRPADRAAAFLERLGVRLVLSALIVLSLVPLGDVHGADGVFLVVFGVEFCLRVVAFFAGSPGPGEEGRAGGESEAARTRRRIGAALFLLVDLLALLSFVPWSLPLEQNRWLRVLRLSRMLVLIGYWSPVVRDLWSVLTRRDRARHVALLGLVVVLLAFAGAAILDHLAAGGVDFNGDGALNAADESFLARLWWSFRQVQDPGNMLQTPAGVIALLVSLTLTIAGLLLVSFLIGLGTDIVRELIELGHNRPVGLRRHFVVINPTPGLPRLLRELNAYYEKLFHRARFTVVGEAAERPQALRAADLTKVHYRAADAHSGAFVERADVATAKRVVVLSPAESEHADAHATSAVLAAREANARCWIVAEILEQANASAARVAGGPRMTLAPTEKFLALYVASVIRHPERRPLLRELMTSREGRELYTFLFDYESEGRGGALLPGVTPSFDWLYREGLSAPLDAQVVPVGWFVGAAEEGELRSGGELVFGALAEGPPRPVRAVVAICPDFSHMERFGEHLREVGLERRVPAELVPRRDPPELVPAVPPRPLCRVLVGGFRPAVVDLAATLMLAHPEVDIQIVVSHPSSAALAAKTLREHAFHVQAGLHREHGPWGTFEALEAPGAAVTSAWTLRPRGVEPPVGRLTVAVADWTSERTLLELPASGGHLGEMDLVVLLGGVSADLDWRTSMTVLKIADLVRAQPDRFSEAFEVVAGVRDAELGRRLREGFARAAGTRTRGVRIFATEELRALFTFQAVAVPGFDALYSELLGPWGHGFMRLETTADARARGDVIWSFVELGTVMRARGDILVAVELAPLPGRPTGITSPPALAPNQVFPQSALRALWVIRPE